MLGPKICFNLIQSLKRKKKKSVAPKPPEQEGQGRSEELSRLGRPRRQAVRDEGGIGPDPALRY